MQVLIEIEYGVISAESMTIFTKNCLTSKIGKKETAKIQQMLNMDEEQTVLKMLATDTYDSLNLVGCSQEIKQEHLNL